MFPPTLKELPPPSLDLYDLDEQFASEKIRLAQLTNKCSDDDVEYYIRECGDILGVSQHVSNPDDPKAILSYVFQEIFKYKCSSLSWSGSPSGRCGVLEDDACSNKAMHEQQQTDNSYTIDVWTSLILLVATNASNSYLR